MDFDALFQAIVKCWHSLTEMWLIKCVVSVVVAAFTSVHGTALTIFVSLVIIDLITRWIALCYKHLSDCSKQNDIISCVLDMRQAFRDKYINSHAMKHRFSGKIVVYMVLTYVAVKVDCLLAMAGESPILLKLVWGYLGGTEAISIIENLRDAGVDEMGELLQSIKSKFKK